MRESDDRAIARARVYVDTRAGALKEGGDIVQPIANGTMGEKDVIADLFELARGQQTGRLAGDATTITLFKSVGAALEDRRGGTGGGLETFRLEWKCTAVVQEQVSSRA